MSAVRRSRHQRREVMRSRRHFLERLEDRSLLATAALQRSGMTAWYRAEGNANDFIGGHNGTLANGATASQAGEVGNAFTFISSSQELVRVGDSPDWIL